jgi:hypothetical protein
MHSFAIVVGVILVVAVLADLVNTLVATQTNRRRYWLTMQLYSRSWRVVRAISARIRDEGRREGFLGVFAPVSVLLLLAVWVLQQVVGFALIWWGVGGISGATNFADSLYYSGVVYFTLGFGEVVPTEEVPRFGALIEAFSGVLTTALVIGYLPALYSAYSERERKLMTLDDGNEDRITPQSLIIARSPGADVDALCAYFKEWEDWISGVTETHTAFPMLMLFRSKHAGQNWITALGVISDAALLCQLIEGAEDREPYWCLRRSIRLFEELTEGVDLSDYEDAIVPDVAAEVPADGDQSQFFEQLHADLVAHGFSVLPVAEARVRTAGLRNLYAPRMEFLIDELAAPRGFWGHVVGHRRETDASLRGPTTFG